MEVETCGESRKVVKSVLIFIYAPVITISLVSEPSSTNKPILLAIVILSPSVTLSGAVFLLFSKLIITLIHLMNSRYPVNNSGLTNPNNQATNQNALHNLPGFTTHFHFYRHLSPLLLLYPQKR